MILERFLNLKDMNIRKIEIAKKYSQFAKYITEQKINIIFAVVGMLMHQENGID